MNKDYEVFISYRHKDCNPLAKALHDRLLYRYHINAFRDDEGLHFGDFRKQLIKYNKRSRFLLLLLTPETLTRCHLEGDWITKEISLFLRRGKPIIPVKIGGFDYTEDMLPDSIKGLMKYHDKCIVCPHTEPEAAADFIARESIRFLREGWSDEMIADAVQSERFLSSENTERDSYFYNSALDLRKYATLLILHLLCAFGFIATHSPLTSAINYDFPTFIFPLISCWLFVIEFSKIYDPTLRKEAGVIDVFLDHSIWLAIKSTSLKTYLLLIPFALAVLVIPFVVMLGATGILYLVGSSLKSIDATEMLPLPTFFLMTGFPLVRMLSKAIIALINFLNSLFGRFPLNYLRYWRLKKADRVMRIIGWSVLVPAAILAGMAAYWIVGGAL